MVAAPTALQVVVWSARSADELFELLRLAGCLTVRGRANRSMVVTLMTRTRDAFEPPFRVGAEPTGSSHGCPTVWDAIEESLTRASYLQVAGWPDAHHRISSGSVEKGVQRIVAEARAARDTRLPDDLCWLTEHNDEQREARRATFEIGPIPCPHCRRHLPDGVLTCVWCGTSLPFICACTL